MTGRCTLADQQAALLQALWQPQLAAALDTAAACADLARTGGLPRLQRGLQAYRSNGLELAARALAAAYPVVAQLLGDNFAPLARQCWRAQPPARGDLAHWGAGLPALIAQLPGLGTEEPYLPDVARLEWALHALATAPDAQADPASFAWLASQDPALLRLQLAPGTSTLQSRWPVVSIVQAHTAGTPAIREAGERLRQGRAETALLWRQGLRPRVREALPGEAAFIAALQGQSTVADAWEAAPGFDLPAWLAPAVQDGLLLRVHLTTEETST